MAIPFPESGHYLDSIRSSSKNLRTANGIKIERENILRLLRSPAFTESFQRVSANHGLAMPLNFASAADELNLISVLSLLNFASGYRVPLHVETGRGAWDNIRAFVFGLYLSSSVGQEGDLLSAQGMQIIGEAKVAELMRVNVHVEAPHETIPGITVGTLGGPMHELVKLVTKTLNGTGKILVDSGYPNLGHLVFQALKDGASAKSGDRADAEVDVILEKLVRALPAFQDMALVDGTPVYCFKKALFLIHAVVVRFGSISPPPFPIPSTAHIPVFTDNVLPSMLIHLGVIDVSSTPLAKHFPDIESRLEDLLARPPPTPADIKKEPPAEGPILTSDESYILRTSAIDACELIIEVARSLETSDTNTISAPAWVKEITLPDLDMWIWSVAKDRRDYRALQRFVLRDTVFF
ncbi:hypothetical protein HGRIS_002273 [Hohenbuehelia grisea]|uniref:Queuosine 5'-phosphate N-glycosylase/hydrolase n=1 Tax=Hohenbuehelia grisea TaxID=104357 RepID=A0ABR3JK00_9AGAR